MHRALLLLLVACGASSGVQAQFDLDADFATTDGYFAFPQPSDLRLIDGHPSIAGLPDRGLPLLVAMKARVAERSGHSLLPVAYFRFQAPIQARRQDDVIPADPASPILLVELADHRLIPVVARTLARDNYVPDNVLAVAARPGFVLRSGHQYAFVVRRGALDAAGERLGVPDALATLADGGTPAGARGAAAKALYAPLWTALDALAIPRDDVAAATVFTTGRPVEELAELGARVVAAHDVSFSGLALADAGHPDVCELHAEVAYPQFQRGTPPFDTDGLFVLDGEGLPVVQRSETARVVIAIPKRAMPEAGYPLVVYIHGSGGVSTSLLAPPGDDGPRVGQGPAHVHARAGIAGASSSMPVNPERLPGASDLAYLNPQNIPAFRDLFRQGVLEQLLFLEALLALRISPDVLAACPGATLPGGVTSFFFDGSRVGLQGQSMGAYYTNLVGAISPTVRVVVPTGAGGYLTHFLLSVGPAQSSVYPLAGLIGPALLGLLPSQITFLHPAISPVEPMLEWSEPIVFVPRLARAPLPGHPARSIYQPIAPGDSYFSEATYDAMSLAYGNRQAGPEVWPSLQGALALDGRAGLASFPVAANLTSEGGAPYTGVVVQWTPTGDFDPHAIYQYMDEVKHQFGCFVESALRGAPRVPTVGGIAAPCD